MTDRKAFEAFEISSSGFETDEFTRDNSGAYIHPHLHADWQTWQASRKQAFEEAAEHCLNDAIAYKKLTMNNLLTENGKTLHEGMYGGAYNCAIALKDMK